MNESRLKGLRVYLSGPIEYSEDAGVGWRAKITPDLVDLGVYVIDPTAERHEFSFSRHDKKELEIVSELKAAEKYDELTKCVKEVVRVDLSYVDRSDLIILRLDAEIPSIGTMDEFVTACFERKPILLFCPQGKKKTPSWIFGRMNHKYIFNNEDEIVDFLKELAFCDKQRLSELTDKRFTTVTCKI